MSNKPLVALVGRPNVGKSTLFNRIVGRRLAVVSEVPGTTRDRLYSPAEWGGAAFLLVDTGGLEFEAGYNTQPLSEDSKHFLPMIRHQANIAIQDADVIVQIVDGQAGLTSADKEVASVLRQTQKPVLVAANKLESAKLWDRAYEFYELALGEVFPVSALHGTGTGNLLDAIIEAFPTISEEDDDNSIQVGVFGRPNVGKSTLINRLLGDERVIVSAIPGTTRDAIDTLLQRNGQDYTLIDTAGIRRRGKIEPGVEKYSVLRALSALGRTDVALLLIDAIEGVTSQDAHIAGMFTDALVSSIILVNKWDAVEKDTYTINEVSAEIREGLSFLPYAPILFISALSGQRVSKILPAVKEVHNAGLFRIPTSDLNKLIRNAVDKHPPPQKGGIRVKILYVTQADVAPPTFVFFVSKPEWVHFSYRRYLENRIREEYPFVGSPIRLVFRQRSDERFSDKM